MSKKAASSKPIRTVALIGNPNTGKSSLFNALCGMNARVGNYPGVTVEQKVGRLTGSSETIDVVDLPGTYSLAARSADEAVAVNVLSGELPSQSIPEVAIVILDAANVERNLYLFSQVYELGLPVIVVLNMWDRVESEGLKVNADLIAERLGVPVICTSANKRTGVDVLRKTIEQTLASMPKPIDPSKFARAQFPAAFHDEVAKLSEWLESQGRKTSHYRVDRFGRSLPTIALPGRTERHRRAHRRRSGTIESRWLSHPDV